MQVPSVLLWPLLHGSQEALKEWKRVLKPGAYLAFSTWRMGKSHNISSLFGTVMQQMTTRAPPILTPVFRELNIPMHMSPEEVLANPMMEAWIELHAGADREAYTTQARSRLVETSSCKSNSRVVSLGEALFDCIADQKGKSREEVESWTPYPGGAPANVAAAMGKLGVPISFISALGQDDLAEQMLKLLASRNVDLTAVQRNDKPTRDVLVIRDLAGDREFCGFGVAETTEYADCFIDPELLPHDMIKEAGALVTGTLGLAYPTTAAAMQKAIDIAKTGPCEVLVDVNWRPVFWPDQSTAPGIIRDFCKRADILKLSDEEAELLYDIPRKEALKQADKVLEKATEAQGVLVTAGEAGCSYAFHSSQGSKEVHKGYIPVLSVDVVETTGAGDAFLAGFLFGLVNAGGLDALRKDPAKLKHAVEFATACGAFTTTKPGAIDAQPSQQEAEHLLTLSGRG
ncbi:hypothetical protein WJX84_001400 [Apatococcus fuscideae]|uniref:Carbohydrate kinase PfkB domain-containing protein n=1 Tax=Apatococcus fuscideae TaxID=2026836 RepID=A0AAW1SSC9_9CHLO